MAPQRTTIGPDDTPRDLIARYGSDIMSSPGMRIEARCIQHGSTSVLEHSASVTALACLLAQRLRIPVDQRVLVRGALLHDYFLYDWHDPEPWHRLHGFRHPYFASDNATRDFGATPHERAVIRTHMFPFVPLPPTSREAWLVCIADKVAATGETLEGFRARIASR